MKVSSWAENKYGNIKCHWRDVFRDGDFEVKLGPMLTEGKQYELDKSDHVLVNCSTMSDNWTQMVTGLRKNISQEVRTVCQIRKSNLLSKLNLLTLENPGSVST